MQAKAVLNKYVGVIQCERTTGKEALLGNIIMEYEFVF